MFFIKTGRLCAGVLALCAAGVPAAFGALERVGPTSTANGYPVWYQDKTGLTLEFCQPQNATELIGGWCLLLPADVPAGAPEVFPTNFSEEHFYWAGNALLNFPSNGTTGRAVLVLGLEGAFGVGPVVPGDQVVFGRIRIDMRNLPVSGTYVIQHPFGTWTFPNQVAGDRLFFTEDIGICGPGQFDCALLSGVGPFLLPANLPGGAELPPVAGPAGLYIADPARIGPVTGSPVGQNFFRIIANGTVIAETNDFSLMGRIFTGTIPGRVSVDRASYTQSPTVKKVDVFATAFETAQPRLPGSAKPPAVVPVLSFFSAPCVASATGVQSAPAGQTEIQMFGAGQDFWGQTQPAAIPAEVCVQDKSSRNAAGQLVPTFFRSTVTDEVTIASATFDPASGGKLTVTGAASSDVVNPVTLKLRGTTPLTAGSVVVTPLAAPPSKVQVVSSRGGIAELLVKTAVGSAVIAPSPTAPVALNDTVTTNEDTGVSINVLANDTLNGSAIVFGSGITINIVSAPRLGTAVVNTATGAIAYTPSLNANGVDGFTYTVTSGTAVSGTASVGIIITPVNDAPTAVNDSLSSALNANTNINVLSNDTDPDGAGNLASALIVTPPAAGATVTGGAGGVVVFNATTAGTYTFTYRAVDAAGVQSANTATVTVSVTSAETITVTLAEYRTDQNRFRVTGTDNVSGNQTLSIAWDNGTAAGIVFGTAPVVAGAWSLDMRPATGIADPRTTGATRIRITSPLGGNTIFTVTVRR